MKTITSNRTLGGVWLALLLAIGLWLAPTARAQTFQVIHTFSGPDGGEPEASVTIDKAGNLYGTTYSFGADGYGNVYQLKHKGGAWIFNPLYNFTGGSDGSGPIARVIFGPDGTLYGTAQYGGDLSCATSGCGTVFQLKPPATACKSALCPWTETVLYSFTGPPDEGANPGFGDLLFDQAGNIYGTTHFGGADKLGVVYELMPSGSGYTPSVLYSFAGSPDGANPVNGLIFDDAGDLYSTTLNGGKSLHGAVFELTPGMSGWKESILYSFTGGMDGANPYAGLVFDQSGNLYGATSNGGSGGGGVVFELSPSGSGWMLQPLLYSFTGGFQCGPGNISIDAVGNVYGATFCDGANGYGNVWELSRSSGGWMYKDLYDFTGGSDGANPNGIVTLDANGNLYGTTSRGGQGVNAQGVVWEITP